jgi:ferredoxin
LADTAKIDIDRCTGCGAYAGVCKKGTIIEVPAETETMHAGTAAGAVVSGVGNIIGAASDAIKRYESRSSSITGSCRKGGGMGRGGGRGIKKQGRRK